MQSEPVPVPPSKEQSLPVRHARPTQATTGSRTGASMMESVDLGHDTESQVSRARHPPPVQPPQNGVENNRRQTQPSVSIEQAAKPTFDITVGDPHKVGDLTSSHIVYQVRTKVICSCAFLFKCKAYMRYRPRQKHTSKPSSQSVVDTGIFFGSTTLFTIIILGLWYHLHQKNKLLVVSTLISLSPGVKL